MRPTRLPVESERIRDLICGKVEANLVTLISGATGSGKSSKVPQMLLARLGGPVLVSQPRRVAAVSLARRVADERGCELGGEVGVVSICRHPLFFEEIASVMISALTSKDLLPMKFPSLIYLRPSALLFVAFLVFQQ